MKVYEGERTDNGAGPAQVYVVDTDTGVRKPLDPRNDIRNHSPDGFQWGYGGSGPAQLALAICADLLQDAERAQRVYQAFKWHVIAPMKGNDFSITAPAALEIIALIEGRG